MTYPSPEHGRARGEHDAAGCAGPVRAADEEAVALQVSADPYRVAHDLADQITHRLFGLSLDLHGALPRIQDPQASRRVQAALAGLDDAVTELRRVIFDLKTSAGSRLSGDT